MSHFIITNLDLHEISLLRVFHCYAKKATSVRQLHTDQKCFRNYISKEPNKQYVINFIINEFKDD
jgi:hypothetical protein